jgi:hypothetical protein
MIHPLSGGHSLKSRAERGIHITTIPSSEEAAAAKVSGCGSQGAIGIFAFLLAVQADSDPSLRSGFQREDHPITKSPFLGFLFPLFGV